MTHYWRGALLTNLAEIEQLLGRPEAAARFAAQAAEAWARREHDNAEFRVALERADLFSCWKATPRLFLVSQR